MPEPARLEVRIDLLVIAAVAVGILLLDRLDLMGGAQIPILVAILVPIVTAINREYGSGEHGC